MQAKLTKKVTQAKGTPKVTELMKTAQKAHLKLQGKTSLDMTESKNII